MVNIEHEQSEAEARVNSGVESNVCPLSISPKLNVISYCGSSKLNDSAIKSTVFPTVLGERPVQRTSKSGSHHQSKARSHQTSKARSDHQSKVSSVQETSIQSDHHSEAKVDRHTKEKSDHHDARSSSNHHIRVGADHRNKVHSDPHAKVASVHQNKVGSIHHNKVCSGHDTTKHRSRHHSKVESDHRRRAVKSDHRNKDLLTKVGSDSQTGVEFDRKFVKSCLSDGGKCDENVSLGITRLSGTKSNVEGNLANPTLLINKGSQEVQEPTCVTVDQRNKDRLAVCTSICKIKNPTQAASTSLIEGKDNKIAAGTNINVDQEVPFDAKATFLMEGSSVQYDTVMVTTGETTKHATLVLDKTSNAGRQSTTALCSERDNTNVKDVLPSVANIQYRPNKDGKDEDFPVTPSSGNVVARRGFRNKPVVGQSVSLHLITSTSVSPVTSGQANIYPLMAMQKVINSSSSLDCPVSNLLQCVCLASTESTSVVPAITVSRYEARTSPVPLSTDCVLVGPRSGNLENYGNTSILKITKSKCNAGQYSSNLVSYTSTTTSSCVNIVQDKRRTKKVVDGVNESASEFMQCSRAAAFCAEANIATAEWQVAGQRDIIKDGCDFTSYQDDTSNDQLGGLRDVDATHYAVSLAVSPVAEVRRSARIRKSLDSKPSPEEITKEERSPIKKRSKNYSLPYSKSIKKSFAKKRCYSSQDNLIIGPSLSSPIPTNLFIDTFNVEAVSPNENVREKILEPGSIGNNTISGVENNIISEVEKKASKVNRRHKSKSAGRVKRIKLIKQRIDPEMLNDCEKTVVCETNQSIPGDLELLESENNNLLFNADHNIDVSKIISTKSKKNWPIEAKLEDDILLLPEVSSLSNVTRKRKKSKNSIDNVHLLCTSYAKANNDTGHLEIVEFPPKRKRVVKQIKQLRDVKIKNTKYKVEVHEEQKTNNNSKTTVKNTKNSKTACALLKESKAKSIPSATIGKRKRENHTKGSQSAVNSLIDTEISSCASNDQFQDKEKCPKKMSKNVLVESYAESSSTTRSSQILAIDKRQRAVLKRIEGKNTKGSIARQKIEPTTRADYEISLKNSGKPLVESDEPNNLSFESENITNVTFCECGKDIPLEESMQCSYLSSLETGESLELLNGLMTDSSSLTKTNVFFVGSRESIHKSSLDSEKVDDISFYDMGNRLNSNVESPSSSKHAQFLIPAVTVDAVSRKHTSNVELLLQIPVTNVTSSDFDQHIPLMFEIQARSLDQILGEANNHAQVLVELPAKRVDPVSPDKEHRKVQFLFKIPAKSTDPGSGIPCSSDPVKMKVQKEHHQLQTRNCLPEKDRADIQRSSSGDNVLPLTSSTFIMPLPGMPNKFLGRPAFSKNKLAENEAITVSKHSVMNIDSAHVCSQDS